MNEGHEHSLPGRFAVFSAKNGKPDVVARFEDDDVWLTQEHLARLYNTSKQNVSQHLKSIFESGELDAETKVKKLFTTGKKEGQVAERPIYHYCLDAIIALGYRIDSPVAIRFRQWERFRMTRRLPRRKMNLRFTVPARCDSCSQISTRQSAAICLAWVRIRNDAGYNLCFSWLV